MKTVAIVLSHYNAWPTDQLVALLDQIRTIPAGHPFEVRIVVNQAEDKKLDLPARHWDVPVFFRENIGYNIGAWDHGWRQPPSSDIYLFLQEECVIQGPGWLKPFVVAASRPRVGLVGESLHLRTQSWDDLEFWMPALEPVPFDGELVTHATFFRKQIDRFRIDPGPMAEHLRSLVLCARREVLEKVGGFPIGIDKMEAISAEIGISRSVAALGLEVRQVGFRPFAYIHHPQWDSDREDSAGLRWKLKKVLDDHLPGPIIRFRNRRGRRKKAT